MKIIATGSWPRIWSTEEAVEDYLHSNITDGLLDDITEFCENVGSERILELIGGEVESVEQYYQT